MPINRRGFAIASRTIERYLGSKIFKGNVPPGNNKAPDKGKIGIFDIKENKINHRLNFYKIEDKKLIEIF